MGRHQRRRGSRTIRKFIKLTPQSEIVPIMHLAAMVTKTNVNIWRGIKGGIRGGIGWWWTCAQRDDGYPAALVVQDQETSYAYVINQLNVCHLVYQEEGFDEGGYIVYDFDALRGKLGPGEATPYTFLDSVKDQKAPEIRLSQW